jgi:hypothetical protein
VIKSLFSKASLVLLVLVISSACSLQATSVYQNSPINLSFPGNVTNQQAILNYQLIVAPIRKPAITLPAADKNFTFKLSGGADPVTKRVPLNGLYFGGYAEGEGSIDKAKFDGTKTNVMGSLHSEAQAPVVTGGTSTSVVILKFDGHIVGQAGVDTKLGHLGARDDSFLNANSVNSTSQLTAALNIAIDGHSIADEAFDIDSFGGSASMTDANGLKLVWGGTAADFTKYMASGTYLFTPSEDYSGSASITDGVFSATGFLSGMPWVLVTNSSGQVLSAQLGSQFFPTPEITWVPPDDASHMLEEEQMESAFDSAPAPVPEPAAWGLIPAGMLLMAVGKKIRRYIVKAKLP